MTQDYDDVAFDHNGCTRDGRYSYRIATGNNFIIGDPRTRSQVSPWVEYKGTETTYNTPNKPSSISGIADFSDEEINARFEKDKAKYFKIMDRLPGVKRKQYG